MTDALTRIRAARLTTIRALDTRLKRLETAHGINPNTYDPIESFEAAAELVILMRIVTILESFPDPEPAPVEPAKPTPELVATADA